MNTSVITVKTPSEVKTKAQEVAKELGFSLSSLVNAYLRQLVKTKTVHFSLPEEPSPFLLNSLKESKEDIKGSLGMYLYWDYKLFFEFIHILKCFI